MAVQVTLNRRLHCLMAILRREAKASRFTGHMPEYKPFSERDNARQFIFTVEDEDMILRNVLRWDEEPDTQTEGRLRTRDGHDYHDLFVFLADIGCRISQALSVRWSDIEYDKDGIAFVRFWRHGEQKGGAVRTIPCTRRVFEVLKRRCETQNTQIGPFSTLDKCRARKLWPYVVVHFS